MADTLNIYQKLVEVRKAVDWLKKGAKMDMGNASKAVLYNPSSQVLVAFREAMNVHGLMLIPSIEQASIEPGYKGSQTMTSVCLRYTIVNADNPAETVELKWYGQGCDQGEKGVGKALTYAEKFLFLKLFNVPTDNEDPDRFGNPDDDPRAKTAKAAEAARAEAARAEAPKTVNVSRATVDTLLAEIYSASSVTTHDLDAWRDKIKGWPAEYVSEVGNAVKAAKERK